MISPVLIERGDGSGLTITWDDGRVDHLDAGRLRAACPCAACQGSAPASSGVTVAAVRTVGAYALGMSFSPDGHATGIYPFDLLRDLAGTAA